MQDIYEAHKSTNPLIGQEESTVSNDSGLQVWYKGKPLEEWAATDPKYTDKETGFSWYVRDGKHPYMTGEDAKKLKEMCKETGESWLKKFAEMAGTASYHEKADYMSMAYALMNDMKTIGNWEGYLRYGKWINDILTFCESKS